MSDTNLLHKWLGGQAGELIQKHGRQPLLDVLKVCERRRGEDPTEDRFTHLYAGDVLKEYKRTVTPHSLSYIEIDDDEAISHLNVAIEREAKLAKQHI